VAGLQTLATFDPESDELILHSPSIMSYKFWPGELGIQATHAVVFARLLSKGKDHGVQAFFVRIRDKDHNPLPGIEVGDIGPKMEWTIKDNGYLGFNNFRVPRNSLLMRYCELSREGEFK